MVFNGKSRAVQAMAVMVCWTTFFSTLLISSAAIDDPAASENIVFVANASDVSVDPDDVGTTKSTIYLQQLAFLYDVENIAQDAVADKRDKYLKSSVESSALIQHKSKASQADTRNAWSFLYVFYNPSGVYAFVGTCVVIVLIIAVFKAFRKTEVSSAYHKDDPEQVLQTTAMKPNLNDVRTADVQIRMYPYKMDRGIAVRQHQ